MICFKFFIVIFVFVSHFGVLEEDLFFGSTGIVQFGGFSEFNKVIVILYSRI